MARQCGHFALGGTINMMPDGTYSNPAEIEPPTTAFFHYCWTCSDPDQVPFKARKMIENMEQGPNVVIAHKNSDELTREDMVNLVDALRRLPEDATAIVSVGSHRQNHVAHFLLTGEWVTDTNLNYGGATPQDSKVFVGTYRREWREKVHALHDLRPLRVILVSTEELPAAGATQRGEANSNFIVALGDAPASGPSIVSIFSPS